ncbi:uncharacterized protein LOC126687774 [Mercurialis annua]|uniref:uncharacterized protein LOC126687774 n=1 Tax=Mercurialis annua TaxID=3986 RepID=UPI00215FE74B|nr:uncharacterized protein LOC126687774 [Mercurialis annua]
MSRLGIRCEDIDTSLRSDSPLADLIISHEFPAKFKYPPNLESYDGTDKPGSCIVQTVSHYPERPGTGMVPKLEAGLDSNIQAILRFISGQIHSMHPSKEAVHRPASHHAKRRGNTQEYIERFNKEAMQIEELSQEIAYTALLNGTTNSDLRKELLAKSPKSFTTLMTIAHTQIRVDDGLREIENRHGRTEERTFSERRNGDRSPIGKRFGEKGNDRFRNKRKTDEDRRYTPLNTTRTNVLFWVKDNREKVRWPRKMNASSASKRDNSKYCEFHRDNGHTTDECWHLKEEIEKLIERGSLSQFVKRDAETREMEAERKKRRDHQKT